MTDRPTVAFARCASYDANVRGAVRSALAAIGGIERFVQPGQSILVKPNLLTDAPPEAGKTTHPEVVRALLRLLLERGARPFVADSPASVMKLDRVWERTGFLAMCREEGVPLVNLEQGGSESVTREGYTFTIARRVLDADLVISVPKVKTHVLTGFTCAVKNMYGCVPGLQKTGLHKRYFKPARFGRLLAEVYRRVRPALAVADGIVGMDGNGPTSGRLVPLGFIAASADPVALDAAVCRLLGLRVDAVPYFRPLQRDGIGETREDHMEILGDAPRVDPGGFQEPNTLGARLVPGWAVSLLRPFLWSRPTFSDRCVSCGMCVRACPASALSLAEGCRPVLDPRKCIECCCCHEVCPRKAVDMQLSPLFQMIRRRDQCLRQ